MENKATEIKVGDVTLVERCPECNGKIEVANDPGWLGAYAGAVNKPSPPCEKCNGKGRVLTPTGRALLQELSEFWKSA